MAPPLRHRQHDHLVEPFLAGLGAEETPARPARRRRWVPGLMLVVLGFPAAVWWLLG